MALLMVHLLAAQRWAEAHAEYRNCPDFYLGAISPDAIHIRDKDDKSRKNMIHLNNWTTPHPDEVIAYWKEHHTPFDIGYGIHVLTDCQWVEGRNRCFPHLVQPDGRLNTTVYYRDTCSTDYRLYHRDDNGRWLFEMVEKGVAPNDHPLLTEYELSQWQVEKVREYRESDGNLPLATYFDVAYVEKFAEECQPLLEETFGRYCNE